MKEDRPRKIFVRQRMNVKERMKACNNVICENAHWYQSSNGSVFLNHDHATLISAGSARANTIFDFSFQHVLYSSQGGTQDSLMAGKKAFEPQQVLEKAMNAFWERGYEGISIEDLVQCTGIGRGSLYDTFGDKHSLYVAALDRYLVSGQAQITALLNQTGSVQEVLEQLFQTYIDALLSDPNHRGCFLVNASLETAPHDPEVNQIVQSALAELEEGFYRLVIRAQVEGSLSWTHDPHQLAHFLVGTLVSIRVLARVKPDRRVLQDVVKTAIAVFH